MTVRCVDCQLFTLQQHAGMAREGFGRCTLDIGHPGRFQSASFPRQCNSYEASPPEDAEKRIAWLREQRTKADQAILSAQPAANRYQPIKGRPPRRNRP